MGNSQRVVISDSSKKENAAKPTFYLTPTADDKLNIHYSPLDSDGEFYYYGSLDSSDAESIDSCISLVVSAMQGKVTDMDAFATDLSAIGLEKKVTKKDKEPGDIEKKDTKNKSEPVLV